MANGEEKKLHHRQEDWAAPESDALDRELDAALAKYAAVEPRAFLEERVLANLRAQPRQASAWGWWRWAAGGALAAVVAVVIVLALRTGKLVQQQIANHPAPAVESAKQQRSASQETRTIEQSKVVVRTAERELRKTGQRVDRGMVAGGQPKLDQFPSPEPLSEQEKMLARYVQDFPEQATLIAQARAEELQRDLAEEMVETGGNKNSQ